MDMFSRSRLLLGQAGMDKLAKSHVVLLGLGGVGGYTAEALARSGIGKLTLVDHDTVAETNLNRQVVATRDTLDMKKVEAMAQRIRSIRPDMELELLDQFFLPDQPLPALETADYVVDAIDTVAAKVELASRCEAAGVPLIAAMGCGNKLSPLGFTVTDIYKTEGCPLCKAMRRELKKKNVRHLKVVYSPDPPSPREEPEDIMTDARGKRSVAGSLAYVVGIAGLMLAWQVVTDLTEGLRPGQIQEDSK